MIISKDKDYWFSYNSSDFNDKTFMFDLQI